jgi:hypothetical protein
MAYVAIATSSPVVAMGLVVCNLLCCVRQSRRVGQQHTPAAEQIHGLLGPCAPGLHMLWVACLVLLHGTVGVVTGKGVCASSLLVKAQP